MFVVHGFALATETAVEVLTEWGEKPDQTDEHGIYYPWSEKDIRDLVKWAEGETYSGVRGDKIRLTGHELDAEVETQLEEWAAKKQIATETMPKPSGNGQTSHEFVGEAAKEQAAEQIATETAPKPSGNGQPAEDFSQEIKREPGAQEKKAKTEPTKPSFTWLVSSAELMAMDMRPEFLVKGILVRGAPCIIGGRSKVLKTSIAVDLALSLGSGQKFLGRYDVSKQVRVAFWTGESGAPTIRETALRIAKSKGIELRDVSVEWSFDLPKLCRTDHLAALEAVIKEKRLDVVIIDPLYLSLLSAETAGSAGNLYAMGAALEPLSRLAQATGCTIILLHHFKKSGIPDPDNPAALEELSQSGAAEWARQWILLQRRTPYGSDGVHDLWMRAGGSAGHSSLVAVSINEGLIDPDTGSGRHWQVSIANRSQAIADDKMKKASEKQEQQERTEAERIQKVVAALESHPSGETASGLRNNTGIDSPKLKPILDKLVKNGHVVGCEVAKNGAKYDGFKLAHGTVV